MVQRREWGLGRELPPVRGCSFSHVDRFVVFGLLLLFWSASLRAQMTDVLTYHNDNARTGQALNEEILTPANIFYPLFDWLWFLKTDGLVDAQPLYAAGISIPGRGKHNVLFVATENDTVYGFDADST